jgi:predicted porin
MKKTLLAVTLLGIFAGGAHAQTSVTLYGILDEGLMFNTNAKNVVGGVNVGGRLLNLDSTNGINGSRWGMKGAEDLGGGLKAVFTLESGINLNTGAFAQGGTPFGRQTFVGLSSDQYGAVTLGRQYDNVVAYVQPVSTLGYFGSTVFAHPGDLDNLNNSVRTNNTVKYASASYNGLTFGTELSLGGQAGNISGGGGYSAGVAYNNGALALGAGYNYFKNPTGAAGAGFFTDNLSGSTQLSGVLNSGYATATSYQVAAAGGTYTIGPALIGVTYSNIKYGNITHLNGNGATFNDVEVAVKYTLTPALYLGAAYNYTKGSTVATVAGVNIGDQRFNQFSLLADYNLSKRTDVYLEGAFQTASGTSSTGGAAVANIGGLSDSSNNHQAAIRLALRTKF